MLAALPLAMLARALRALRRWPASVLGLFRDRVALVQNRTEVQAPWAHVAGATLADQSEWGSLRWPELRITERLTVRLRSGRTFSFRPRTYGLDPGACRDLFLRVRDDAEFRSGLPEFDSLLDMALRPLHAGLTPNPRL
jgi:hypothetical protein